MAKTGRGIGKEAGLGLLAAGVFALGMFVFLKNVLPSDDDLKAAKEKAAMEMLVPTSQQKQGPNALEQASQVGQQFVQSLRQGQFEAALALTAKAYREATSPDQFAATCKASAYLSSAKEIKFFRVTQHSVPVSNGKAEYGTASATGMLLSDNGNVDITVAFAPEGNELRILTILAAGIPIFDGVTAVAAPSASASAASATGQGEQHRKAK